MTIRGGEGAGRRMTMRGRAITCIFTEYGWLLLGLLLDAAKGKYYHYVGSIRIYCKTVA